MLDLHLQSVVAAPGHLRGKQPHTLCIFSRASPDAHNLRTMDHVKMQSRGTYAEIIQYTRVSAVFSSPPPFFLDYLQAESSELSTFGVTVGAILRPRLSSTFPWIQPPSFVGFEPHLASPQPGGAGRRRNRGLNGRGSASPGPVGRYRRNADTVPVCTAC